jgi:TPR repeat protein
LAYLYENGKGVEKNPREALILYTRAAAGGHPGAQFQLALFYQSKGSTTPEERAHDEGEAMKWYREAATRGHAKAQRNLGSILMGATGDNVPQKHTEAVDWLRKATAQNDELAAYNLAYMYEHGRGIAADAKSAAELYAQAALQGLPPAQFALGNLLAAGKGVPQDARAAVGWFQRAASKGHAGARLALLSAAGKLHPLLFFILPSFGLIQYSH